MNEAVRADRVIVIDDGRIFLDGTPKQVFSHVAELQSVGLDVPQAAELAYALRQAGYHLPDDILDEEECAQAIFRLLQSSQPQE